MKIEFSWKEVCAIVAQRAADRLGVPGKTYNPDVSARLPVQGGRILFDQVVFTVDIGKPTGELL